jgi:hypothetical protein
MKETYTVEVVYKTGHRDIKRGLSLDQAATLIHKWYDPEIYSSVNYWRE